MFCHAFLLCAGSNSGTSKLRSLQPRPPGPSVCRSGHSHLSWWFLLGNRKEKLANRNLTVLSTFFTSFKVLRSLSIRSFVAGFPRRIQDISKNGYPRRPESISRSSDISRTWIVLLFMFSLNWFAYNSLKHTGVLGKCLGVVCGFWKFFFCFTHVSGRFSEGIHLLKKHLTHTTPIKINFLTVPYGRQGAAWPCCAPHRSQYACRELSCPQLRGTARHGAAQWAVLFRTGPLWVQYDTF